MTPKDINKLFNRLRKNNPNPTTELKYNSNFELLISVLLSAQATDISVNKATEKLFAIANTPWKLVRLGEDKIKNYIKSIGLFNNKARNIFNLSKQLITLYNGQVPNNREELESLPGVGRKTANVILNTAFKKPTIAVDTHIFRVANRLGLATAKTPLAIEKILMLVIPKRFQLNAHHWLILHGRYTCKARKPDCRICILKDLCFYNNMSEK